MELADRAVEAMGAGAGAGSAFFAFRWCLNWLTGRADRRQAALDAEHATLDMSWKEYRLFLERERKELSARIAVVERQSRAAYTAFQHVAAALIRHDPHDPALKTADQLMTSAFPLDFTLGVARAAASIDQQGDTA